MIRKATKKIVKSKEFVKSIEKRKPLNRKSNEYIVIDFKKDKNDNTLLSYNNK